MAITCSPFLMELAANISLFILPMIYFGEMRKVQHMESL